MRFNPPPTWPPPPAGWRPDATWRPDPAWPAPPADWPLWVSQPRQHRGVLIGFLAVVLVAAVGLTAAIIATTGVGSSAVAGSQVITCEAKTASEKSVCDSVRRRFVAYIDGDRDRVRALTCQKQRGTLSDDSFETSEMLAPLFDSFKDGTGSVTVSKIDVDGTRATVVLDLKLPLPTGKGDTTTLSVGSVNGFYVKEGGTWKACGMTPE